MAKDGTRRGGARLGSGKKKKALTEVMLEGRKATIVDLPSPTEITGEDMPPIKEFMKAKQKNGEELVATSVYKETWSWLKERGCTEIINVQLIEQYAMSVSRWIQCEEAISEFGMLAKHPTTGNAITSPYVTMSQAYMKQVNQTWFQIFQIVKENSTSDFGGLNPQDDVMERLLSARKR